MKQSLFSYLILVLMCAVLEPAQAGTFTSNVSSGAWNVPGSWSFSGDADGIPDVDDNVTVLSGHTISITGTGHKCLDLTVAGVLQFNSGCNIAVWGNYTVTGSESGGGSVTFRSTSGIIDGSGLFGSGIRYSFVSSNYTITSAVTILKSVICNTSGTIINNGYVRFNRIYGTTTNWINNSGSTLELNYYLISDWVVNLDASATGNNVMYTATNGSHNMINPIGGIYYNLEISGVGSSKRMPADIHVLNNLTLGPNAALDSEGFDIYIGGNFVKSQFSGNVAQDPGTSIIFNGTAAQSLLFTGAITFNHVVTDNPTTVTFSTGTFNIANSLTVLQGTCNVGTNKVTMISNATSTAYLGESAGTIIGSMICQRFITGQTLGRDTTWADLASPVQNTTFADWDGELFLHYSSGQDAMAYSFNEVADDFVPVASSGQSVLTGQGFEVFLADSYSLSSFANKTLTSVGTPNMGDQDLSGNISFTSGNSNYNLVGNPFQSNILWSDILIVSSNIASTYEYYDYTVGTYTVDGGSTEIPTGQGFWVLTTGSNPQMLVPESAKTTSSNSTLKNAAKGLPYLSLVISSADNSHTYSHKLRVGPASGSSLNYDNNDHPFRKSPNSKAPAIYSTTADGKNVVIYGFGEEMTEVIIPFTVKVGVSGDYKISASDMEYVSNFGCVALFDNQTGKSYDLNAQSDVVLEGLIAGTTYANRFELRLSGSDCSSPEHIAGLFENSFDVIHNDNQALVKFHYNEPTPVNIQITNAVGQVLVSPVGFEASENTCTIQLPADFSGMYLVTVINGNGSMTKKLIK